MQLLPTDSSRSRGPLSTRRGTLGLALILALLAGGALLIFLREYKDDITGSDPVQVLVARSLVPKGTSGAVITSDRLYRLTKVEKSDLKDDAITDPDELSGKIAAKDINPGHQLKDSDFESGESTRGRLGANQRALSVPLDSARGMIGNVEPGDRVDVLVTFENEGGGRSSAHIAARNVLVLAVPDKPDSGGVGGTDETAATLRVNVKAVPTIAAAVDAGKVWLVLRPSTRVGAGRS